MTTVELYPDAELAVSNLTGQVEFLRDNDEADWYEADDDDDDVNLRVGTDDASADLDGEQTAHFHVRRTDNSDREPEATFYLYEGGSQITTFGTVEVESAGGATYTYTFDEDDVGDPTQVEFRVEGAATGGQPNDRNTVEVGYITWEAQIDTFVDATTLEPTDITTDAATLNGEVDWQDTEVEVWFEVRPIGVTGWTEFGHETYTEPGTIQHDYLLEDLEEDSIYECRFQADMDDGADTDTGDIVAFSTNRIVEGTVTVDGDPVEGATVFLTRVDDDASESEVVGEATTDAEGEYSAEVPGGEERQHVAAQYDDGSEKYHGESKPNIGGGGGR